MQRTDDGDRPRKVSQTIRIVNRRGLHARAAARFVKLASEFEAEISVSHADVTVSGTSIMGLLTLGASQGTELRIDTIGSDAESAATCLASLVAMGFGEEPD